MRRSFKLSIAAVAILVVLCTGAFAATESVEYLDGAGVKKTRDGVTVISEATQSTMDTKKLDQEWYVVRGHPKFTTQLYFTNPSGVNIILADGATLEASYTTEKAGMLGSAISTDHAMTIYAQSTDRETMGRISADRVAFYGGGGDWTMDYAIHAGSLSIQGGMVKARGNGLLVEMSSMYVSEDITVEAHAVLEAGFSAGGGGINIWLPNNFISSGDVTLTAAAPGGARIEALEVSGDVGDVRIVGGVFRAIALARNGDDIMAAGVSAGRLLVEGGWADTYPNNYSGHNDYDTPTEHTGGALIVGDRGTVKKTAVIPAGMTATLRDGVELTLEDDAKLIVEPGAKLDASGGTLADAANKVTNDGVLVLPASMTKEQIKALKITGTGKIYWKSKLIHADDGERNWIDDITEASKKFADASSAWTPDDGDWKIAIITEDAAVDVAAVSIDGEPLDDADGSASAAQSGELSARAQVRTVVISAATLSALANETAPTRHDLRITMRDGGYADLEFWVSEIKTPEEPSIRSGSSGGCAALSAATVAIVGLAAMAVGKRRG